MQLVAFMNITGSVGILAPADANQFADVADARAKPHGRRIDQWQRERIDRPELVERRRGEGWARDVVDDASERADFPGGIEQAGLLLAGQSIA
jgi:hypothetical protein